MVERKISKIFQNKRSSRRLVIQRTDINRRTCRLCGIIFYDFPSKNRIYCSRKCASKENKNIKNAKKPKTGIWKKCQTCRKDIYIQKWQARNKRFCSNKCKANHPDNIKKSISKIKNIDNKGKKNPRYINGKYCYRKAIFTLKENKCIICGEKYKNKLLAHHLDNNRENNNKNNLMIVCFSCHNIIHKISNKTKKQKERLINYSNLIK